MRPGTQWETTPAARRCAGDKHLGLGNGPDKLAVGPGMTTPSLHHPPRAGHCLRRDGGVRPRTAGRRPCPLPLRGRSNGPSKANVRLTVNGQARDLALDPRTSLLDALRDHLGLAGTKKGCDHGQCGACTVLVNGVRLNACMSLAVAREGDSIVTIEGLASNGSCIRCRRPSSSMTASSAATARPARSARRSACSTRSSAACRRRVGDLAAAPQANGAEIRERMSGNICRCSAYPNIVAAIMDAQGRAG